MSSAIPCSKAAANANDLNLRGLRVVSTFEEQAQTGMVDGVTK